MSTQRRIYLDFNATAPLGAAARAAMSDAMAVFGNPSSIHAEGRHMRDRVERARAAVSQLVGRPREQIVFTSGGTEANTLGVFAHARALEASPVARRALVANIEHPSLVGAVIALRARGWEISELDVSRGGEIRVPPRDEPFALVALAAVNHELGTVANVAEWSSFVASAQQGAEPGCRARVHVDAVQAVGKLDLDAWSCADSIAISAHKLGGPQGVGALAIAGDAGLPLVTAGHQERGRRPGTENALGIIGFGAAAAAVDVAEWPGVAALGQRLEAGLRALPGVRIHGDGVRIGGTINAGFSGALGESIAMALDLEGISVSTGAACTSGSVEASPVLLALGMTATEAREAVRFSLGRTTTAAEIDAVLAVLPRIVERVRKYK